MELMLQPLRKYADFQGRARRSEYWLFTLFIFIVEMVIFFVLSALGAMGDPTNPAAMGIGGLVFAVLMLGLIVPSLAVSVRRLHDTNRSGWWLLISFLPVIGAIVILVFSVLDGTPGPNRFGPDPKGRELKEVFA